MIRHAPLERILRHVTLKNSRQHGLQLEVFANNDQLMQFSKYFALLNYIYLFQHKHLSLTVYVLTILASLRSHEHFVHIIIRNESITTRRPSSICTSSIFNAEENSAVQVSITLSSSFSSERHFVFLNCFCYITKKTCISLL